MKKMELEDCGPGCDCGKSSGNTKVKVVVCLIVLLAVGTILAYKVNSASQTAPSNTDTAFAAPLVSQDAARSSADAQTTTLPAVDTTSPIEPVVPAGQDAVVAPGADLQQAVKTETPKKKIGEFLDSLGSLNKVAVNQDAVFVFLPAKGSDLISKETTDAIASAKQKIEAATGAKLGLYTLQSGSQEYANIAAQLPLPGMLVMSKGRGMGAVSGGITEEKILQAYVASNSAGCGPSGCGPSGCGPSGCGPAPIGPRR
jgi:hypothetical protein